MLSILNHQLSPQLLSLNYHPIAYLYFHSQAYPSFDPLNSFCQQIFYDTYKLKLPQGKKYLVHTMSQANDHCYDLMTLILEFCYYFYQSKQKDHLFNYKLHLMKNYEVEVYL